MYRIIILLGLLCLAGCRSNPPPPNSSVNVTAPGVNVSVQDDGGVTVRQPAGTVDVR
jgi:hypothetical protein